MSWWWLFAGPTLLLAALSLAGERRRAAYVRRMLAEPPDTLPPATVIVPVKGHDEGLRENLAALDALDYPDYELIIVAQSAADIPPGVLPPHARVLLAHGTEPGPSEKVRNLGAAVQAARQASEILAFADSDGRVTPRWLRALAAPLSRPENGASTGFRWFVPRPAAFWPLMRGVWDAVAGGRLGDGDSPFAWGGAMAICKETFLTARVPEYWKGTVADDYALSAAVHAAGLRIAYAPGALTPCLDGVRARRFFSWMRRQMMITRVYNPELWRPALFGHLVYCGGMAAMAAAAMGGSRAADWALLMQLSIGMFKGWRRAALARAALPEYDAWFRRYAWVHALWTPLATWLWLWALFASAAGNTIEWRGRRYVLKPGRPEEATQGTL